MKYKKLLSLPLCLFMLFSFSKHVSASEAELSLSAASAILIEAESGRVLFEKKADVRLPMASTTKIMTALVAIEKGNVDDVVEVHPDAVGIEGSSVYLKAGERYTKRELLYALLLQSANDAAAAIAISASGSIDAFADEMNELSRKLGLENTHFTNPHGLDDSEHYTTARDLACITAYALKNETFSDIVSAKDHVFTSADGETVRTVTNHNKLLRTYEGACGVKTGFTKKSGRCLVSAAERDGVSLIAVTLKAPSDWKDHEKLLNFGFSSLERRTVAEIGEVYVNIPCIAGEKSSVRCSNREALSLVLPAGAKIATSIEAQRYYPAPINEGDALATAVFYSEGKELARIPLYAEYDVGEKDGKLSFIDRVLQFIGR